MKKLIVFLVLSALIGTGCEKEEEDMFEIDIGDKNAVIQKEVNGIEFKFCLLNEVGEPATVFKEGENFTFHFSFKNSKNDTISVTTEFVNDDFFRVYQISSDKLIDVGKPWTGLWCEYSIAAQEIELKPSFEKQLKCPWLLTENGAPDYPLCMSESKDYLDKGKYTSSVFLNFHYTIEGIKYIIDDLTFTINFEIL
ncbi:hypothetical protein [Sunxiuqinia elliptica]|uniref:Lipoprotein n=1 Tax=Sunxiuqinia elliptica TaxID=655355 RepID=A0A4R6HA65_9BACT|nr:hypothetical protein [Sunxiuqinia elliptica]TDO04877.1 hypothetical protein DET52_101228 [Sunxiuqinia elliptica]TDO64426.1 hypothetical protein DET65_0787 [Sunxiuqinia elliptica]